MQPGEDQVRAAIVRMIHDHLVASPPGSASPPAVSWSALNFNFRGATFYLNTTFNDAVFKGRTSFERATFGEDASPGMATWFISATFHENTTFERATFKNGAWFASATFGGRAEFEKATFAGLAAFGPIPLGIPDLPDRVHGTLGPEDVVAATFSHEARFIDAHFGGTVSFAGARPPLDIDLRKAKIGLGAHPEFIQPNGDRTSELPLIKGIGSGRDVEGQR